MDSLSDPVKQRRPYDRRRRQQQALDTRTVILEHARNRFLTHGYASTTIASVAEEAGVSVDTIYKTFGGKSGLVRSICALALAGDGQEPAETRSDRLQATQSDPIAILRGFAVLAREVAPRVSPVLLLVRDASASDPEMAELRIELERQRLVRMTHNARNLHDAGHLQAGLTVKRAGEIMWTYSAPELYELLVIRRRWTLKQFGDFVADAMIAALLADSDNRPFRPTLRQ